jgi:hypothetical protein
VQNLGSHPEVAGAAMSDKCQLKSLLFLRLLLPRSQGKTTSFAFTSQAFCLYRPLMRVAFNRVAIYTHPGI